MSLRSSLPYLARNEGVWEGWYRHYDAEGRQIDAHKARLICRIRDDRDYHQTNLYRWADGRREDRDFPAVIEGERIRFAGRIDGWAQSVDIDEHGRTMMLHWTRVDEPGVYFYEMIQMADSGDHRARVWHWFRDDRLFQRTLIDEHRLSDDWRAYEDIDPDFADIDADA